MVPGGTDQLAFLKKGNFRPIGGSLEGIFQKQIIDTPIYEAFGNLVGQDGSSKGNLSFQGKYYDRENSLYYFYQRYYNPVQGRFLNEDPIGLYGGLNLIAFVTNNPINWIDLYGLIRTNNSLTIMDLPGNNFNSGQNGFHNPSFIYQGGTTYDAETGMYSPEFTYIFNAIIGINIDSPQSWYDVFFHEMKHHTDWWNHYNNWVKKLEDYEKFKTNSKKKCDEFLEKVRRELEEAEKKVWSQTIKNVDGYFVWIMWYSRGGARFHKR